ncbi:MAG: DUF4860 domain-containing protein [Clostridia bacterium]|nr:DUF4860 domain-containing protein [Lachnospiraceae bacterium]NCB99836.1 DUF4860 domain-containing protein [Clostridia bacterium]NCD02775.1 DUF4860 domain-containing protein [Clostridia bacterium]
MKVQKQTTHMFDFIFVLALFCVFSASAFLAVVIGANVYQKTMDSMETNYTSRTATAYITEKIRHNDITGSMSLVDIDNTFCLSLVSVYGDTSYTTYIYNYQGSLKELFIKSSDTPNLASGETIMSVSDFSMEKVNNSLYRITVSDVNSDEHSVYISIRSDIDGREAAE